MAKRFVKVDPDEKGESEDVARRMFAALKIEIARNELLEALRKDRKPPQHLKGHRQQVGSHRKPSEGVEPLPLGGGGPPSKIAVCELLCGLGIAK